MRRVLLTGLSGTGKSTIIEALAARGYKAIDADTDEWSEWVSVDGKGELLSPTADPELLWRNQDWVWREGRMHTLLSTEDTDVLFVGGTAPNQGKFRARFDHVILLSAPADVLMERLSARSNNSYGKHPYELARVLEQAETVEPMLRRAASREVDTSASINEVLETILDIVQP